MKPVGNGLLLWRRPAGAPLLGPADQIRIAAEHPHRYPSATTQFGPFSMVPGAYWQYRAGDQVATVTESDIDIRPAAEPAQSEIKLTIWASDKLDQDIRRANSLLTKARQLVKN